MKTILKLKRIYLLSLIPIALLLTLLAQNSVFFAEHIYALRIYKWISQAYSLITGILPFSVAEFILIASPFVITYFFIRFIIRLVKSKGNRAFYLVKGLLNVGCVFSVFLFLFVLLGGINYHRYEFSHYSNLEVKDSTVTELYALTHSLMLQANELRAMVPQTDEEGVFQLSMDMRELGREANKAYENLAIEYPVLGGRYGAPKPVLLSPFMSRAEITGIFIPFTMEANVNTAVPHYSIPATMLHEIAHQRGFMREDEADYLAYLASMASNNIEIQYSGTMLALITSGNALFAQSPELYFEIRDNFSEGVIKDMRASAAYWSQFRNTVISTVSNKVNDTYLKVNSQEDGVKSYGRMVDLLLAQYRKQLEGLDL